jgi:hypothetical protein
MRQRFIPAVFIGEKADRYWAVDKWFDDAIPSEKIMTEKERMIASCEALIAALKNDQAYEMKVENPEEQEAEIGWEQSAKDTEKRSRE